MDEQKMEYMEKSCDFGIFDLFDDGEHLWFTALEYNALFKMDKQTHCVEYVGSFPNETYSQYRLYSSIAEYQGKLYFTPCSAHEIGVYDMKREKFEKISIGIKREDNDISKMRFEKKFISSFIQGTALILIPFCYNSLIICDLITNDVSASKEMFYYFYNKYHKNITLPNLEFHLCRFAERINESEIVFNLQNNANVIVYYNLDTGKYREQKIGYKARTFTMIEYDGENIWLYDPREDTLVRWSENSKEYAEVPLTEQLTNFQPCGIRNSFANMIALNGWIYLIPENTNYAVKVDTMKLTVLPIESLSAECLIPKGGFIYSNLCRRSGNSLYLFGYRSKTLMKYEEHDKLQKISLEVSNQGQENLAQMYLADEINRGVSDCLFMEEYLYLEEFVDAMKALKKETLKFEETKLKPIEQKCGNAIYEYVKATWEHLAQSGAVKNRS